MQPLNTIALIGLGLIGGSLAARIHQYYPNSQVYGVDINAQSRHIALKNQWIHQGYASIADLPPTGIDLAIVCTPLDRVHADLLALQAQLTSPVIISDVASVKTPFSGLDWPSHQSYIGGHPMSGSEQSGIAHAYAGLLDQGPYSLMHADKNPEKQVTDWLTGMQLSVVHMRPDEHDAYVAMTSHGPYFLACALSLATDPAALHLVGPGFRDMTRIARHDPAWGQAIWAMNQTEIRKALTQMRQHLDTLATLPDAAITAYLTQAKAASNFFVKHKETHDPYSNT